ncbi:hypothetical protein HN51_035991 [Arachis hypogaea]
MCSPCSDQFAQQLYRRHNSLGDATAMAWVQHRWVVCELGCTRFSSLGVGLSFFDSLEYPNLFTLRLGSGHPTVKRSPNNLVKQPHYKFFVWVDDHIVRLRGVELTRALGDNKPNDDEEHLGKKELENMMANLEERIVKLEKRKSINCRGKGLEQLSSNASNSNDFGTQEVVSGFLYDKLQKEVVNLRKSCEVEDSNLQAKHEEIKMLTMKGDGLMEAMEVELKKMKREAAAREKEVSSSTTDEKKKTRSTTPLEGSIT